MITQYGVLAYDVDPAGEPRFLLITSRSTRRWIIPRGNPIAGLSPSLSAAEEAYEEAGIAGAVAPEAIGSYLYEKKRGTMSVAARVHVFPLHIRIQSLVFPEQGQRETRWFSREEAAAAVDEPELRVLILAFEPSAEAAAAGAATVTSAPLRTTRWRLAAWLKRLMGVASS